MPRWDTDPQILPLPRRSNGFSGRSRRHSIFSNRLIRKCSRMATTTVSRRSNPPKRFVPTSYVSFYHLASLFKKMQRASRPGSHISLLGGDFLIPYITARPSSVIVLSDSSDDEAPEPPHKKARLNTPDVEEKPKVGPPRSAPRSPKKSTATASAMGPAAATRSHHFPAVNNAFVQVPSSSYKVCPLFIFFILSLFSRNTAQTCLGVSRSLYYRNRRPDRA